MKWKYIQLGSLIALVILLITACGAPVAQPPGQTDVTPTTNVATPDVTAVVEEPTPTMVPGEPTPTQVIDGPTPVPETPTPVAENPTPTTPDDTGTSLPSNQPWIGIGTRIYVDPAMEQALQIDGSGTQSMILWISAAPDGSSIAYVEGGMSGSKLNVRDLRTGETLTVPGGNAQATSRFSYSPDSQSIVYSTIDNETWQLVAVDLQSGTEAVLQQGSLVPGPSATLALFPIAWTTGGIFAEHIIWASDAPPQGISRVDPDTGDIEQVRQSNHVMAVPAPDGASIAIVDGQLPIGAPPVAEIIRLDVASGEETVLVPEQQTHIRSMVWSPDGTHVLLASSAGYEAQVTEVHAMTVDGSSIQTVEFGVSGFEYQYRDLAWRDNSTPLVLVANAQGALELHELPLDNFNASSLRPLGTFAERAQMGMPEKIVYSGR